MTGAAVLIELAAIGALALTTLTGALIWLPLIGAGSLAAIYLAPKHWWHT